MSVETKKRKADEGPEEKAGLVTLGEAWELMLENGPDLHKSMEEYLTWLDEIGGDPTEMMGAAYFKVAEMENKFVVPTEFSACTVIRDKKGEVTQITDANNNTILNEDVKRVLIYSVMREKGFKAIIMNEGDGSTFEVLAIPSGIQIEDTTDTRGKKDFHGEVRMMYTNKSGTTIYASRKNIVAILKLDYVTLSEVSSLLKALNALEAKEDLSDLDSGELADVSKLQQELTAQVAKQSRRHFYQTLLAAKIRKLSTEERLEFFKSNAAYTLANNLEFRLPHSGPCYTKLGNKPLTPIPLGSAKPDDDILMATNIMSQKDYKEIVGDVTQYKVYVNSDELGGRKGTKFANMSVKFLEKAKHVSAMLTAISSANTSDGKASESGAPGKQTAGLTIVKLGK